MPMAEEGTKVIKFNFLGLIVRDYMMSQSAVTNNKDNWKPIKEKWTKMQISVNQLFYDLT